MNNWPKVKLGEVLKVYDTAVPVSKLTEINLAGIYSFGRGLFKRGPMFPGDTTYKSFNRLFTNDFVISSPKAWEGALARVTPEFDGWYLSPVFPTFRVDPDNLFPAYLEWYCKQESVWAELQSKSRGIGARRESVHPQQFLSLEIPLPPLTEQRRIVARVEELAAQINEARTLNRKSTEEAEALHANLLRAIMLNCQSNEIELETVCAEIIDNLHSNPHYSDSGVACVRSPDVGKGVLNLEMALRTDEEEFVRRTVRGRPQTDDVVFVREGGGTGKCALVLSGQRFSLGQRVMILRPKKQIIDPRFFLYQLLSPLVQEEQIGKLSKGSASPHLNIGALRRFRFRLPQLSVQRLIVAKLNALQAEMDSLKHNQAETSAELDALLPAILDRAFKGDLL